MDKSYTPLSESELMRSEEEETQPKKPKNSIDALSDAIDELPDFQLGPMLGFCGICILIYFAYFGISEALKGDTAALALGFGAIILLIFFFIVFAMGSSDDSDE